MDSPTTILEQIALLDMVASGLLLPLLPAHLASLDASQLTVGAMIALYTSVHRATVPAMDTLTEFKGRKQTFLLTLLLSGVACALLGLTSSIFMFFVLRAFIGVFKHTQQLVKLLAPDFVSGDDLPPVLERLDFWKRVGMAFGPILAGHVMAIFPEYGFTLITFIVGAIFAVNSSLVKKLPSDDKKDKETEEPSLQEIAPHLFESVSAFIKESVDQFKQIQWETYREVYVYHILLSFTYAVYFSNFIPFLKLNLDASPIAIGYVVSILLAVGSFYSYYIHHINVYYIDDSDYSVRNKHVFIVFTGCLLGMLISTNVVMYILFVLPLGISTAVGRIATLQIILNKTNDDQKAIVPSIAGNISTLAGIIAPLFVGVVSDVFGISLVMLIAIALSGFGVYECNRSRDVSSKFGKRKVK